MLERLREYAKANNVPIIREESGRLLYNECETRKPKKILEIGTAIGYSGILMLNAVPDGFLTTIEKDDNMFSLAMQNFKSAGVENRVRLIHQDADKVIDYLVDSREKYDFIFLDGAKGQYIKYLPRLKTLLNKGGILFADDIYYHGLVKQEGVIPHKNRTMVNNLRQFILALEQDNELDTKFLEIEDGISISELK